MTHHPDTHVYADGVGERHLAMIAKQHRSADSYRPEEPWLLLHDSGRVDRFAKRAEAIEEASKSYQPCLFRRH